MNDKIEKEPLSDVLESKSDVAPVGSKGPLPIKPAKEKRVLPGDEGKPQIKIYDIDGRLERKKRAVEIGLSELILPPWTRGITAKYKILSSERIDPATGKTPEPKDVEMPGTYMLYDKFEKDPLKKNKLMRNLGRPNITRDGTGKEVFQDTIETVQFVAGVKTVNIDKDYRQYVFMELHPLNKSNRHRSTDNSVYFERVDLKYNKSSAYLAAEMDLGREAEEMVMAIKDKNEIIGMAVSAMVYQPGLDPGALKVSLRQFAREKPKEYFKLSTNNKPGVRLSMLDALQWGFISHETDKRRFVFCETDQPFFTYSVNENPIDALVEAIVKPEYANYLKAIMELVDFWE